MQDNMVWDINEPCVIQKETVIPCRELSLDRIPKRAIPQTDLGHSWRHFH